MRSDCLCFILVKSANARRHANEMAARAIVSSIHQFSHSTSSKLRRIIIVDHQAQIKRMSKRVQQYQRQIQTKSNHIDLDADAGLSFTNIFGVPKITQTISSSSESDDDNNQPEEYTLPYIDQARS